MNIESKLPVYSMLDLQATRVANCHVDITAICINNGSTASKEGLASLSRSATETSSTVIAPQEKVFAIILQVLCQACVFSETTFVRVQSIEFDPRPVHYICYSFVPSTGTPPRPICCALGFYKHSWCICETMISRPDRLGVTASYEGVGCATFFGADSSRFAKAKSTPCIVAIPKEPFYYI